MTKRFFIVVISCLLTQCYAEQESFIVPKKEIKKKESKSHIQEDIASCILLNTQGLSQNIESESRLLGDLLKDGEALLAQDKKNPINQASPEELQQLRSTLQDFSSQLAAWQKYVSETSHKINNSIHTRSCARVKK